jgi:hypothetical protein
VKQEGIPVTDWLIDSFYGNADIETLISILEQIPPGISELMSHPGYACIEETPPGMDKAIFRRGSWSWKYLPARS